MPLEKCKYLLKSYLIIEPIEFALWLGYLVDFPANHGPIQYICSGAKPQASELASEQTPQTRSSSIRGRTSR